MKILRCFYLRKKNNLQRENQYAICVHKCTCAMQTKATCLETIFRAIANIIKRYLKKRLFNRESEGRCTVHIFLQIFIRCFRAVLHLRRARDMIDIAHWITRQLFSHPVLWLSYTLNTLHRHIFARVIDEFKFSSIYNYR